MSAFLVRFFDKFTKKDTPVEGALGAAFVTSPNNISLIDNTSSATYTYFGEAPSGSSESSPVWVMSRMTNATGNTYPISGNLLKAWSNRLSETYS